LPKACFSKHRARKLRSLIKVQDQASARALDISQLLETHTDVKLLLAALFSKRDLWLFKHQRKRIEQINDHADNTMLTEQD
jgi:hypothetical protein